MDNQNTLAVATKTPSTTMGRKIGIVLGSSLLVGLAAQVVLPLPFTVVPLSMAPFAVMLLGLVLTPRLAFASLVAYLIEGSIGFPFFSPTGPGGLAHLAWPTAGYLIAFPVAAYVISALYRRSGRGFIGALLSATFGSLLLIAMGAFWLSISLHLSALTAFSIGVLPFLPGDAIKVLGASVAVQGWQRIRK